MSTEITQFDEIPTILDVDDASRSSRSVSTQATETTPELVARFIPTALGGYQAPTGTPRRISAEVVALPAARLVKRLLAESGLEYVVVYDRETGVAELLQPWVKHLSSFEVTDADDASDQQDDSIIERISSTRLFAIPGDRTSAYRFVGKSRGPNGRGVAYRFKRAAEDVGDAIVRILQNAERAARLDSPERWARVNAASTRHYEAERRKAARAVLENLSPEERRALVAELDEDD